MNKRKKILITGLCITLASSLFGQEIVGIKNEKTAAYRTEVLERIAAFSPLLEEEVQQGRLGVEFYAPDFYLESKYNTEEKILYIACVPDFSQCDVDATEHELAHHIEERQDDFWNKFRKEMAVRVTKKDFSDFSEAFKKLMWRKNQSAELAGMERLLDQCEANAYNKEYAHTMLAVAEELVPEATETKRLREMMREYDALMPCTTETYSWIAEERAIILENRRALGKFAVEVYFEHKLNTPKPTVHRTSIYRSENYEEVEERFWPALESMTMRLQEFMPGFVAPRQTVSSKSPEERVKEIKKIKPLHDSHLEEIFAGGVDSLVQQYVGPATWAKMNFTLTPELLNIMTTYEYKGHRILAPWVKKYRANPEVQQYWREHDLTPQYVSND